MEYMEYLGAIGVINWYNPGNKLHKARYNACL